MKKNFALIALLIIFWVPFSFCFASDIKFISISDIHFDPYFTCKTSQKLCPIIVELKEKKAEEWLNIFEKYDSKSSSLFHNTNYGLLKEVLAQLEQVQKNEKPQFVIILGDFLAHDFRKDYFRFSGDKTQMGYKSFVRKTFQFLTNVFNTYFPEIDIYPVVGNNDSYTGDYGIIPNGPFFQETAQIWAGWIKDKKNRESFLADFQKSGYYKVSIPHHQQQKIIILNTVLFSGHTRNPKVKAAAEDELNWLQHTLEKSPPAIIAEHIPLGIDAMATAENKFRDVKQFWRPPYVTAMQKQLKEGKVKAMLAGHVHSETFQILIDDDIENVPVYFTPSVSPIYGNYPAFKVFTFSDALEFKRAKSWYYPIDAEVNEIEWKTK